MTKQPVLVLVLASGLLAGCGAGGIFGPTPTPTSPPTPTPIPAGPFWTQNLNPLVIEFRGLDNEAGTTPRNQIQSAVNNLTGVLTKLQILEQSGEVPTCAQAGLATAIGGASQIITGYSDFGNMSCIYSAGGPNCDAQDAAAGKELGAGRTTFESGVSTVQSACRITGQ